MAPIRQGGFLISKIHQLSGRIFAAMLRRRKIEINPAQGRILFALWVEDGITIQELGRKTGLSKSTLTRMLDRMELSGHLVRVPGSIDRRQVFIRLTEQNRKMKTAYEDVSAEMVERFYAGFSEKDITQFEGYLQRVLENLNTDE